MVKLNAEIAGRARQACEKWRKHFHANILKYHQMHEFVLGKQWEEQEEDILIKNSKIPLTCNKLATLANTWCGEQQQNTPQLQVVPKSNCTEEIAHIYELILKDITLSTNSKTVYQIAGQQAFIGGFSAYLIDTYYKNEKSFDQDFIDRSFKDATCCYWDISAEEISKIDGMWGGYTKRISHKKLETLYGKDIADKIIGNSKIAATKEEVAAATSSDVAEDNFSWGDEESTIINYYYERTFVNDALYKLSNNESVLQDELDELIKKSRSNFYNRNVIEIPNEVENVPRETLNEEEAEQQDNSELIKGGLERLLPKKEEEKPEIEEETEERIVLLYEGQPVRIEEKRVIKRSKITQYQIAGDYILEESISTAKDIPIPFVDQNSYYDKDGKQVVRPFLQDCIDTQRYINYLRTQCAYILKVSRYDQYMGSKKNVQSEDTKRNWKDPQASQGMLTYDESPTGAKPEALQRPELSQSLLSQYQLAIDDLYTSTGIYPSRMGAPSNEISGKAINARNRGSSSTTFGAFNSINRAIEAGAQVKSDMIPGVYDSERVISLMTSEDGLKKITINKQSDEYGEHIENDIRKGSYEVSLKPGPSYEGQKQEAIDSFNQVIQASPQTFNLIADLYADNLPLPNNIEIKNRLKTIVPPEIIEAGKTGQTPNMPKQPSPEEQAMAMEQQNMQLKAQNDQKTIELKTQELELKKQEIILDARFKLQELENQRLESAERIKEQELRYLAETQRTESDAAISHADNLVKILTHKRNI